MAYALLEASAPGSIMMTGEHAVLQGKQAIVAAIQPRITVQLTLREDKKIFIQSSDLGEYETDLAQICVEPPFQYVLSAIKYYLPLLKTGFELDIVSEFSHKVGLGSSAAVSVAMVGVLNQLTGQRLSEEECYIKARCVVRTVQSQTSAADVAASVYGGMLAYCIDPLMIESIGINPSFHLVYTGYKTPTADVVKQVQLAGDNSPEYYQAIFQAIHCCSCAVITALKQQNWQEVGKWFHRHQGLQIALGVSCPVSEMIITALAVESSVYGAKISGSGKGDCILALGDLPANTFPQNDAQIQLGIKQYSFAVTNQGLQVAS